MNALGKLATRFAIAIALLIWGYSVGTFFLSCHELTSAAEREALPLLTEIAERDWLPTADARKEGGYWLSYDGRTKTARYVCEVLHAKDVIKNVERTAGFKVDANAPKECRAGPKDYAGSGYDQGHLAPAANWAQSEDLQSATFILSNAVPQAPACNRIAWRMLEAHVRDIAARSRVAVIVTGPAYIADGDELRIELVGGSKVWKPTHIVKAVVWQLADSRHIEAAAWLVPNVDDEKLDWKSCSITIDDAESALGVDLFAALPDSLEPGLESTGPPEAVKPRK